MPRSHDHSLMREYLESETLACGRRTIRIVPRTADYYVLRTTRVCITPSTVSWLDQPVPQGLTWIYKGLDSAYCNCKSLSAEAGLATNSITREPRG